MTKEEREEFEREEEEKIKDCLEKVYRRVNTNPAFSQPVNDLPIDRVLGVRVADVIDIIGDLDLIDVEKMVSLAMRSPDGVGWVDRGE